jgi:ribosomal protein S18 acetylase RimI-like enzyme
MRIRHVLAHEGDRLREIRLRALKTDPYAYGTTHAGDLERPASWWEEGARRSEAGVERRFIAVDSTDRWVGLALVREDDEAPGDAVINAMWVAPEARGLGLGRELCSACVAWARAAGFPVVRLTAKVGNAAAIGLYEAFGFERVGVVEDEFVFALRLERG